LSIFTYADFTDKSRWEPELARLLNQLCGSVNKEDFKISISKLPVTGAEVFGREKEVEILDKAWEDAHTHIVTLVAGLRKAGTQHNLPWGLFARAAYYRVQKDYSKADEDLNEAKEIAEMGSMGIHLCDYHLEAGRVFLARGEEEKANDHFQVAKEMIDKMGYHRRDAELFL
jgi:tetratricopeptide (TPR) repeat protein